MKKKKIVDQTLGMEVRKTFFLADISKDLVALIFFFSLSPMTEA